MPEETISCYFVLTNIISDDITTIMNSYWIDSVFFLELKTLCIKQGESDLHWLKFSSCHTIPPQFSSVKADGQQMWVRWKEFVLVLHFTELSSSSLLNHIASPGYLPCEYFMTSPVWHFDQQHSWWSYNDSTTLTYLVFH